MSKESVSIFWFRRDLRLNDNVGLYNALQSSFPVLPIFIFDKNILEDLPSKKDARLTFIHQNLCDLNSTLKEKGTSIETIYHEPLAAFKQLLEKYNVQEVYTNEDYEPYAITRDAEIAELLNKKAIPFKSYKDQVIFAKNEIVKEDGKPYLVYTPYSKRWISSLTPEHLSLLPSGYDSNNWHTSVSNEVISLADMGFVASELTFPARKVQIETIVNYENERDIPSLDSTSRLGVHLRFGTISIRELVSLAKEHGFVFLKELIWREFFMTILFHFPRVVDHNYNSKYDPLKWRNSEEDFNKWKEGKTGYPLVDAGMRQLNKTGFMHNRVRMLVASFLTKHLLIDWKWGEAYFAEKLLDYELAANNGNWQWAAGTGVDAQPYFRVFNPSAQLEKFDSKLAYVKKWVPEYGTPSYPSEMVDHKTARLKAIDAYKQATNS